MKSSVSFQLVVTVALAAIIALLPGGLSQTSEPVPSSTLVAAPSVVSADNASAEATPTNATVVVTTAATNSTTSDNGTATTAEPITTDNPSTTETAVPTTPNATTSTAIVTPSKPTSPATQAPPPSGSRRFDAPSFFGGIILAFGLIGIGYVAFKFYRARTEHNYHSLHETVHM